MGDAVRDVSEQELLAPAHPDAADDDHVGTLPADGFDDRLRRIFSDDHRRAAAFAGEVAGVLGQLARACGSDPLVEKAEAALAAAGATAAAD